MSQTIIIPWPPALLSGHSKGNAMWAKILATKKHRAWAFAATKAEQPSFPAVGDIRIKFRFEPPNRRGDRTNYPNRLKPAIDGIAQALGVNDSRFLPSYEFGDVIEGGRVVVEIEP